MTPRECWQEFMGNLTPAEFMAFFDAGEPGDCVRNSPFVKKIPDFMGIIRRGTWKETFAPGREQINRLALEELLIEYLEQTRQEWEELVREVRHSRKANHADSDDRNAAGGINPAATSGNPPTSS
ncbi:MAG TPA: hypothetical protein PKX28_05640 [Candidatus Hydrogenedentes bacterium]|nr:hypothetical protein [Candidatus Hydrogenedentota bacterium]HOJ69783.1 hypothetical protein [Candidatus Hydrogenedentota bacterium]HOK88803.1 hypothetical protein [Candidatus Hydrogenedentota bacterium]HPO30701.1 hypothetical protein [Candidatus Hydrogenedentota bacterium]